MNQSIQPSVLLQLLNVGAQFAYFLLLIAALIYVVIQRDRCPRPAKLLIWALSLMLFSNVARAVATLVMTRALTASQIATGFHLLAVGSTCLLMLAIVLIVKAVFADRTALSPYVANHDESGRPLVEQPSDNPYASPRQ